MAVVRALFGYPQVVPGLVQTGKGSAAYKRLEWLKLSDLIIPVDEDVMTLVPYFGGQGTFPYISACDVLHDRVNPDDLNGAIVLVGTTSPGLMDQRATPMAAIYPGVEVHANMIAGILDQKIKKKPAYAMGAELLILLATGLLLSLLLPFLTPFKSTLLSLLTLACAIGINMWAWKNNTVLPLAASVVMIPLIYIFNMSYGFFIETRAKRKITGLFGQYVPRDLVVQMSKNPEKFSMEGESRELTVLFADVRNFTSISESLSPKELSKMMNEYMSSMTSIIQKHVGTIDKYIGDAIMAFWGAPLQDLSHARNGILAALEMQQAIALLRPQFVEKGWPAINIGVGLNSGMMRVGNMGSEFRIAYTVMGDAVNLGSRLEGITKEYGIGIIVGETTRNSVNDIVFRELDLVRVKGKNKPVAIYEPLGLQGQPDQSLLDEVSSFEQSLKHYRAMEWDSAERLLSGLQELSPQRRLYNLYLERIAHFRANPPVPDWDGVFQFTTK
jgi:adenylate cyclase